MDDGTNFQILIKQIFKIPYENVSCNCTEQFPSSLRPSYVAMTTKFNEICSPLNILPVCKVLGDFLHRIKSNALVKSGWGFLYISEPASVLTHGPCKLGAYFRTSVLISYSTKSKLS